MMSYRGENRELSSFSVPPVLFAFLFPWSWEWIQYLVDATKPSTELYC